MMQHRRNVLSAFRDGQQAEKRRGRCWREVVMKREQKWQESGCESSHGSNHMTPNTKTLRQGAFLVL